MHMNQLPQSTAAAGPPAAPRDDTPVAILMAIHAGANAAHFDESLASLRAQTHSRLRLFLFCDGALPPAHEELLGRYAQPQDGDVILRSPVSVGLPTALNTLIDRALRDTDVEFLARMDADDLSMPERIARQVEFMRSTPEVDLVGTWCIEFEQPGVPHFHKRLPTLRSEVLDFMVCRSPLVHPTVMFRRKIFDAGFRYEPSLLQAQDYDLWSRLVRAGFTISNVPEYLLWYRMADGFFQRRSGLDRALKEVRMRIEYARDMKLLRPIHLAMLFALLLTRIAPEPIKRLAYRRSR